MYFSTSSFSFDGKSKVFSAEISELMHGKVQFLGQIYPDACDEGIFLVSHKTGETAVFYLNVIDVSEGEYRAWELLPTTETLRKQPRLAGYKIVVFND